MTNTKLLRSRMSRKVHVRFWSRVGRGDLPCLDNYHLELNCFCVIELKSTEFKPEFAGKMNFYLSAVDDLVKRPNDNPAIGILLCKSKNATQVEYALRGINTPIGVASFQSEIVDSLPENLKSSLPTIEEIENEMNSLST